MSYQVQFGYCLEESETFATFEEALVFYRGYSKCQESIKAEYGYAPGDDGPSLVNPDNIDGAEDASAAAQHGLTREQWEQVEEVG